MDKILSARVDEAIIRRLSFLARRLGTSKKAVIERAIYDLAEKVEASGAVDELTESFGTWHREEAPEVTVERARGAFRDAMERHHR